MNFNQLIRIDFNSALKVVDSDHFLVEFASKFHFAALEFMNISDNNITSDGLDAFFCSLNFPSLTVLIASKNKLTRSIRGPFNDLEDFPKKHKSLGQVMQL